MPCTTSPLCVSCVATLAAAKARGVSLGGDRGNLSAVSHLGRDASKAVRVAKADDRAKDLARTIAHLQAAGASLRAIAAELNERGIKTARGSEWTAMAVKRVVDRL